MKKLSSLALFLMFLSSISFSFIGCVKYNIPEKVQGSFQWRGQDLRERQKALFKYITKRTVRVVIYKATYLKKLKQTTGRTYAGWGTGSILNYKNGYSYIMTAEHVAPLMKKSIDENREVRYYYVLEYRNHKNKVIKYIRGAKIVATNAKIDISILKVKYNFKVRSVLAKRLYLGERVSIVGYPFLRGVKGAQLSYSHANVSTLLYFKKSPTEASPLLARWGGAAYFGNSGGAVWNYKGEIVGVVTMITRFKTFLGTYIPQQDCAYGPSIYAINYILSKNNLDFLKY